MKTSIASAFAALAISAAIATPSIANVSGQSIEGAIQSAISTGNINVNVENGVATLFGWVESKPERNAVRQAALSFDNVNSIVDLIQVSD